MDELTTYKVQYRMEQWAALIQQCQASEMTIRSWCKENSIKEGTYYYWLKRIREKLYIKQLPAKQPKEPDPVSFAKVNLNTTCATAETTMIIHLPYAAIEVKEGVSQQSLKTLLQELKA